MNLIESQPLGRASILGSPNLFEPPGKSGLSRTLALPVTNPIPAWTSPTPSDRTSVSSSK
jgi:hypothetical protein